MFIEMTRDEDHGGGTWGFPNCVWAPTRKKSGGRWPFWELVKNIQEGDVVIHLCGVAPNAHFVGYSIATCPGFETERRPPNPGEWAFASTYFRADLRGFVPFHKPIRLAELFLHRRDALERYFDRNADAGSLKKRLFYVRQRGHLQCLNGAYLSHCDDELFAILFGAAIPKQVIAQPDPLVSVETSWQLSEVRTRIGQQRFARQLKDMYGGACCFPGCSVDDHRFLVASHIARWSDNEALRGNLGNGLCLCLFHDRAFELGIFTIDEQYRVVLNPREGLSSSKLVSDIQAQVGKQIRLAEITPLDDAILEHWLRTGIAP